MTACYNLAFQTSSIFAAIFEELLKGMNIFENQSASAEKRFESLGPGRFLFERIISLYNVLFFQCFQ